MAKYKAGKDFKGLENKHFGPHKIRALENGEEVEITSPELIPEKVFKTLSEVTIKKGDK